MQNCMPYGNWSGEIYSKRPASQQQILSAHSINAILFSIDILKNYAQTDRH
jgi:hypothetical protein